jgi:hypothetical protein
MSAAARAAFLVALHDGCAGLCEVRALPSTARAFVPIGDVAAVERFISIHQGDNLYVAVATRRDDTGGDLANALDLPALFVDLDFKTLPEPEARDRLGRFPLRPSAVVDSGGGLHVWWFLREPMTLPADTVLSRQLLRRLAHALGGDLAAAEPARILRLPGTRNFKYAPPRPVALTIFEPDRRYNPGEFDAVLHPEPAAPTAGGRFALPETIQAGERNSYLYRAARSYKALRLTAAEMASAVEALNGHRCVPPLDGPEVLALCEHAWLQPDQPGFVGSPKGPRPQAPAAEEAEPSGLVAVPAGQVIESPPPIEIVQGLVWAGAVTLAVAEAGAGKTFVALAVGAAICEGRPWCGRRIRQGSVVYLSYEGDALNLRLRALRDVAGRRLDDFWVVQARDPLSPQIDSGRIESPSPGERHVGALLDELRDRFAAEGRPPVRLLVVDTVRCSLSGSEDQSDSVAGYLRAVRRIMTHAPDAGALLLHHAGWPDAETRRQRERGSSAWRGNVDATIYVEVGDALPSGGARLVLSSLKVRDAERPAPLHLLRSRVDLAIPGPDGLPLTSCVIEHDPRSAKDRQADAQAATDAEARSVDLQVLKTIAIARPDLSTSLRQIRALVGLRSQVVEDAVTRLVGAGWLTPPARQREPYVVTRPGLDAIREHEKRVGHDAIREHEK